MKGKHKALEKFTLVFGLPPRYTNEFHLALGKHCRGPNDHISAFAVCKNGSSKFFCLCPSSVTAQVVQRLSDHANDHWDRTTLLLQPYSVHVPAYERILVD